VNIHPQLQQDCFIAGRFSLCYLLLMQDANYPWFILVPDRAGISEVHQLQASEQQQLMTESVLLSRVLEKVFSPDKLNIAALGNIVPQLHIHHIVRYRDDPAWPDPVWGRVARKEYDEAALQEVLEKLGQALAEESLFTRAE